MTLGRCIACGVTHNVPAELEREPGPYCCLECRKPGGGARESKRRFVELNGDREPDYGGAFDSMGQVFSDADEEL